MWHKRHNATCTQKKYLGPLFPKIGHYLFKNELGDLPRNITICAPHECQLTGKFFLTFELQWLDPPNKLLLLTIKDSNHREILKYIPIIAFTAVHGHETAIITYMSPKIQEWTGRHQKDLLCQALINILSNAKDSMPNGGSIVIETGKKHFFQDEADRLQLPPGEYCYFKIRDFGCGMSREVLERAFEPFFTTKPFGKGKGLGLFLVHGIAKQLGGNVYIESSVEYGTSVYFYVPAVHEDMDILPNQHGEKVLFDTQPKDFSSLAILLVEDEDVIREILAGHLESLGSRVIKTRLGEEAINILRHSECEPDLLIADLALLGMDAKRLLREARAFYPELPGIIISGYPLDIAMDLDIDPELTMFLKKPFSVHDLTRAIKEILSQKLLRYCSTN